MHRTKDLYKAVELLKDKCKVVPEKYAIYNGAYLFLAYPRGISDKEHCMTPWYLVDLKRKSAGHFSPAFDMVGFIEATEHLKIL